MMRLLLLSLWVSSFGVCALGAMETYRVLHDRPRVASSSGIPALAVMSTRTLTGAAYDSAVSAVIAGNLFRRDRSPATEMAQATTISKTPLQRPHIELRGLMGGPPWQALIDGVPGHPSSVLMRVGESVGGITVSSIRAGSVVVRGADTVWHLTLPN